LRQGCRRFLARERPAGTEGGNFSDGALRLKLRVIVRAQLEAEAVDALDAHIIATDDRRLLGWRRFRTRQRLKQRVGQSYWVIHDQ
jgi:hypothetical protein